jgi:ABC-type Mn2+/Zn2+ transport system permease subunit
MPDPASIGSFLGDPLADPLVRRAAIEVALIGMVGGALGCWIVHYGLPYAAESVAHCMLPGLVVAALAGAPLILGGAAGLLAGVAAIGLASRVPGIGRDTAVAVAVTTLFGLGALLALSPETPPNLQGIPFDDVLAVSSEDLAIAAALVAVTLAGLAILHPRLLAVGFDAHGARAIGVGAGAVEAALLVLLAAAVLVAVQGLGNLLAVASLVGPAAVARMLAHRMAPMMVLAAALATAGGLIGLYASYHLELAAGASIAGATVLISIGALALAPVLARPPKRPNPVPTIVGH